jgi:hypothetical protein
MIRILMIGALVGALAFAATPRHAEAALMDGKAMLNQCKQPSGTQSRGICLGYIAAIADALAGDGVGKRKACFPTSAKLSAMRDAVIAHLEKQKKAADEPATDAVTVVLVNRFSC